VKISIFINIILIKNENINILYKETIRKKYNNKMDRIIMYINNCEFHIFSDKKKNYYFDLQRFAEIHEYSRRNHLVKYYGNDINIMYGHFTDFEGLTIISFRARKIGVKDSYKEIKKVLKNERFDGGCPQDTPENIAIKQIKKHLGNKDYEYIQQYEIIVNDKKFRIDLLIKCKKNDRIICVEIDEEHHKYTQEKDKKREDIIKEHIDCDFVRIKYNSRDKIDLAELDEIIDYMF